MAPIATGTGVAACEIESADELPRTVTGKSRCTELRDRTADPTTTS
jgi:acyl-coenzyme A synthetase/AMP-(fatty) acid ligase